MKWMIFDAKLLRFRAKSATSLVWWTLCEKRPHNAKVRLVLQLPFIAVTSEFMCYSEDVKSLRTAAKELRTEAGSLQNQLADSRSNEIYSKVQNEYPIPTIAV